VRRATGAARDIVNGMTQQLSISRPAATVAALAAAAGLASGVPWYLNRSDVIESHVPGTEALIPHIAVALVVAIWFVAASRRSPLGAKVVFAPLGRPIMARVAATFRRANPLRWLAVGLIVFLEVYMCWRIGAQVFAGLDPNFVHNAWGGPSYLGAMLFHYLDGALLFPICHTLLRWATVPAPTSADRQHEHPEQPLGVRVRVAG